MQRPYPPTSMFDASVDRAFIPAPELIEWARQVFIEDGAELENPEHKHLLAADIGMLWTNVENTRRGRTVLGQCEVGQPSGKLGKWGKARAEQQIVAWFGKVPDFIVTISASYASTCADAAFCALVEHELLHCGQERDEFGAPKFNQQTGRPIFGLRGHDVEEFISVVRRYGISAAGLDEMIAAARKEPEIAAAVIDIACGTCLARAA